MSEQIGVAVMAVIALGAGMLANRWGLLGAGSVWRTCLFWAASGVILMTSLCLTQLGVVGALSLATLILMAVGALGGVLAGLLMAYMARKWPN